MFSSPPPPPLLPPPPPPSPPPPPPPPSSCSSCSSTSFSLPPCRSAAVLPRWSSAAAQVILCQLLLPTSRWRGPGQAELHHHHHPLQPAGEGQSQGTCMCAASCLNTLLTSSPLPTSHRLLVSPHQQLCDTLMQYFTSSAQVRLYRSTVVTLLHNPPAVIPSQVAPEVWRDRNSHHHIYSTCMFFSPSLPPPPPPSLPSFLYRLSPTLMPRQSTVREPPTQPGTGMRRAMRRRLSSMRPSTSLCTTSGWPTRAPTPPTPRLEPSMTRVSSGARDRKHCSANTPSSLPPSASSLPPSLPPSLGLLPPSLPPLASPLPPSLPRPPPSLPPSLGLPPCSPSLPHIAYSDFLVDYKVPGDEYLPLGPSFQEHVTLFVKRPSGGGGLGALPMATFPIRQRDREEAEVLRPETARLITQLELVPSTSQPSPQPHLPLISLPSPPLPPSPSSPPPPPPPPQDLLQEAEGPGRH